MLYLLGGENTYESNKRLDDLKAEFVKKNKGRIAIFNADEEDDYKNILTDADSFSLFSQPKLIVVKRLFSARKDFVDKITDYIQSKPDVSIVFWEDTNLDKRRLLYKEIKQKGIVEEFKSLKYPQLKAWVSKYLSKKIRYDQECIDLLILKVGENQTQLETILDNLVTLCQAQNKKQLTTDDIHSFVAKTTEESI